MVVQGKSFTSHSLFHLEKTTHHTKTISSHLTTPPPPVLPSTTVTHHTADPNHHRNHHVAYPNHHSRTQPPQLRDHQDQSPLIDFFQDKRLVYSKIGRKDDGMRMCSWLKLREGIMLREDGPGLLSYADRFILRYSRRWYVATRMLRQDSMFATTGRGDEKSDGGGLNKRVKEKSLSSSTKLLEGIKDQKMEELEEDDTKAFRVVFDTKKTIRMAWGGT
ncbi:hypothetical protein Tco_1014420 [Tanacetum coccineum]